MSETKPFTAAQIKLNHERANTAVQRLNYKAWTGIKYEAVTDEDKPAIIIKWVKNQIVFTYQTLIDQTIGHPVSYENKYNASNRGTMCYELDRAETRKRNQLEGLRSMESNVEKLREELASAEAAVAQRRTELGL